jgi:hypothetical protein
VRIDPEIITVALCAMKVAKRVKRISPEVMVQAESEEYVFMRMLFPELEEHNPLVHSSDGIGDLLTIL